MAFNVPKFTFRVIEDNLFLNSYEFKQSYNLNLVVKKMNSQYTPQSILLPILN